MKRVSVCAALLVAVFMLGGCASDDIITQPAWPALSADEVVVHPSLQQLLATHHPLKVVLRVPNANNNVTQSQSGQVSGTENAVLNSAYDDIEKRLFEAGFIVRDRALLSTLIQNQGLTSYKEIQSRIDTDLIIDISSMSFNDPGDWLTTNQYTGDNGGQVVATDYNSGANYGMGQAVASVEAQFIIVSTGDVGGIVRLEVPLCRQISCKYEYTNDGLGDTTFSSLGNQSWVFNQNTDTLTYLWATGNGPGTFSQAADLIAKKLVQVLQGAQTGGTAQ